MKKNSLFHRTLFAVLGAAALWLCGASTLRAIELEIDPDLSTCTNGVYEVGKPDFGFLFPAFANRCAFLDAVDIFTGDAARPQQDLIRLLLGKS